MHPETEDGLLLALDLRSNDVRYLAYELLGEPLVAVPSRTCELVARLISVLQPVAEANDGPITLPFTAVKERPRVPRVVADVAASLVKEWQRSTMTGADAWMPMLEAITAGIDGHRRWFRGSALAGEVVRLLRVNAIDVPDQFLAPKRTVLRDAGAFLDSVIVTTGKPGGGALSPWGAARSFAKFFGVTMPKKKNATRERKTPHRRNSAR